MQRLSSIWLVTGIALLIWFSLNLLRIGHDPYMGVGSGAFKATLAATGFGLLVIIGALGLRLKRRWGKTMVIVISGVTILYLLTGGFLDGGIIYAIIVLGIAGISIATIVKSL